MAIFYLELSAAPAALIDIQADLLRLRRTALESAGPAIRVLHAAYIPARETCLSLIDGADRDSVSQLLQQAGVRANVLAAVTLT